MRPVDDFYLVRISFLVSFGVFSTADWKDNWPLKPLPLINKGHSAKQVEAEN